MRGRVLVFIIGSAFLISCQRAPQSISSPISASMEPTMEADPARSATPSPAPSPLPPTPKPFTFASTEETPEMTLSEPDQLVITIVFDNNEYDQRLETSWGFSALVEYRGHSVLFDTGGNGGILLLNMQLLEIDPAQIESVVLSHAHGDHTGGLEALLDHGAHPAVYLLPSFPSDFKQMVSNKTTFIETSPGQLITDGIYITGEISGDIPEEALVVKTTKGLVVITGCAHPGVVNVLRLAKEFWDGELYLVLGGFHLRSKSAGEISTILKDFRQLGVVKVAPAHCTGDQAILMFQEEYGDDFIKAGVGKVIIVLP